LGADGGVLVKQQGALTVDKCTIANFPSSAIRVSTRGVKIAVQDSTVRNSGGIVLGVETLQVISAAFDRARLVFNSGAAIATPGPLDFSVTRSIASANAGGIVFWLLPLPMPIRGTVENSLISDNSSVGLGMVSPFGSCGDKRIVATRSTLTRNQDGGIQLTFGGPCEATLVSRANLLTQNTPSGIAIGSSGASVIADGNTVSGNAAYGFDATQGIIKSVRGADGSPGNAGEQTTPTTGNVVPMNPF
jgi:Right handed beta helix region